MYSLFQYCCSPGACTLKITSWSRLTRWCYMLKCKSSRITISNSAYEPVTHTHSHLHENWLNNRPAFSFFLLLSPMHWHNLLTSLRLLQAKPFIFLSWNQHPTCSPTPTLGRMNLSFTTKTQFIWNKLHHPLCSITQGICHYTHSSYSFLQKVALQLFKVTLMIKKK